MSQVPLTWATIDRIPTIAMNATILTDPKPMTCGIENKQEHFYNIGIIKLINVIF